jgi:hypothetical protein
MACIIQRHIRGMIAREAYLDYRAATAIQNSEKKKHQNEHKEKIKKKRVPDNEDDDILENVVCLFWN